MPSRVRIGPRRVRDPWGMHWPEIGKTSLKLIFDDPRSSLIPGSATDPNFGAKLRKNMLNKN